MLDMSFGGIQQAFLNYSIELANRGFKVHCIVRKGSVVEKQLAENAVASVQSVSNHFGFYDNLAIRSLTKGLSKFFCDSNKCYILTFDARSTLFAGKAALRFSKWKVVASLPNSVNHKYYQYADLLIPSTHAMASAEYHKNLLNPNFSEVIPLFSRIPPALNAKTATKVVKLFTAGRFVRKKGFDYLIESVSQLVTAYPEIHLRIAGDGPERNRLNNQCRNLNLSSKVEFLGYRTDTPDLIADSDLLIVPSTNEPFGIILLEGMAVGTPIVTTRSQGALELLDSDSAKFADIASSESLTQAICDVIDDLQSTNERSATALSYFKQRYTPDAVISKFLSVLEGMN